MFSIYKTEHKYYFHFWLSLILFSALITRLLILNEFLSDNPFSKVFFSDDWVYWIMAGAKAAGDWHESTPFLSAPLFPYVLGFIRWIGGTLESVFIFQLILGWLSLILIAAGSKKRFGATTALLATAIFAFCEEPTLTFTKVMADSIQLFLVATVWFIWCHLSTKKNQTYFKIFITGLILGLLVLAWPPSQILLIGYAFWLFLNTDLSLKKRLLNSLIGLTSGLIIISPASLHNYKVDGEFSLVSANAGINLLQGNNKNAQGIITPINGIRTDRQHMYEDAERVYVKARGLEGNKVDSWKKMDDFYKDQAVDFLLNEPEKSIPLLAKKFYWFLSSQDYDNISVLKLEQEHGLYQWAKVVPVELPWLMGLALLGLLILSKDLYKYTPEFLILLVTIFACVMFHYSARYRLPAAPILCILSAVCFTQWRSLKVNSPIKLIIVFLPVAFIVFNQSTGFSNIDFMRNDTATKIAHAYIETGDLYARSEDFPQAQLSYEKAVKADPDYQTSYLRLLHLGAKANQPKLIEHWVEEMLSLKNAVPEALKFLFNSQLKTNNFLASVQTLEKLSAEKPNDLELQQKLIWLLTTNPNRSTHDAKKAMSLSRKLLSASSGTARIGALVTFASAQLASGKKSSAEVSLKKAIKLAQRKGLNESVETLLDLQKSLTSKDKFAHQVKPFEILNPWDLSKPHPMDLIEL